MARRPFVTEYYSRLNQNVPDHRSGFPKKEEGSIRAAAVAISLGYVAKVKARDRETMEVLWTKTKDGHGGVKHIAGDDRPARKEKKS